MDPRQTRPNLASLLEGNQRFRGSNTDYGRLARSQHPEFVVVSCSDSRVSPSVIMDAPLGTIFEIRTAGQVLDTAALGSIEFAVRDLGTRKIVILGHSGCGAVTAAYAASGDLQGPGRDNTHLSKLVGTILADLEKPLNDGLPLESCIRENIHTQAKKLMESMILRELISSGELEVYKAVYDLESGEIEVME